MSTTITVTGFVATEPKHTVAGDNLAITSFRLGSSERRYNRTKSEWENSDTSWFSVTSFRYLATNTFASIKKGDRIVVSGRIRVRPWEAGGKSGIDVEIDADAIGPDLNWNKVEVERREKQDGITGDGGSNTTSDSTTSDGWATEPIPSTGSTEAESTPTDTHPSMRLAMAGAPSGEALPF